MAKKLISYDEEAKGTGLPAPVEQRLSQKFGKPLKAPPFLDIPTPDGLPSVGHPDVIAIEGGWNGYEYWMGFTPYPAESRENPCIVASHDGVNWVVPDGLTNPIAPFSEAVTLGYNYWSDTDLVHLPDNRLACYFRGTVQDVEEVIVRKVSSDGVNWGPLEVMFEAPFTGALSPAIVVETDGTFSMWSVNNTHVGASPDRLERRTSLDGVNWSAPTVCTTNYVYDDRLGYIWHVDVVRVGDRYHALVATRNPYRLLYLSSKDGITWEGDPHPVPLTGHDFDQSGHYRSTMVAVPGGGFDLWITGINSPQGEQGEHIFSTAEWRVALLRGVRPEFWSSEALGQEDDSLWGWATHFAVAYGNPTAEFVASMTPTMALPSSTTTSLSYIFEPPPSYWAATDLEIIYTVANGGAPVRLFSRYQRLADGRLLSAGAEEQVTHPVVASSNTTHFVEVRRIDNSPPNELPIRVTVGRAGGHEEDTLEEPFRIVGIRLRRATN